MRNIQPYYEFGINIVLFLINGMSDFDKETTITFLKEEHLSDDELIGYLSDPSTEHVFPMVSSISAKLSSLRKFDERTAFIIGINTRMLMRYLPQVEEEVGIALDGAKIIEQTAEGLDILEFEKSYIDGLYSVRTRDDLLVWQRSIYNRIMQGAREDKFLIGSKIFLSHKSADKSVVREYSRTLRALGFEVWLDEDAMHAGVELERSILEGFEQSCAAIFFITPNYVDENYLRTEINYAIAEKRKKGDRFSLITLVLASKGEVQIPKLLEQYVWKSPASDFEGLREIIKALPISITRHDWRRM